MKNNKKKRKSQNQQDANLTFSTLHTARWDISIEQLLDKKKLIFKSKYKSTDEKEKNNFNCFLSTGVESLIISKIQLTADDRRCN